MPKLIVSHEVVFKIRALRRNNEESEDWILARLLGTDAGAPAKPGTPAGGFYDATYGLLFPEGMEIFRVYKGRRYSARVTGERWVLDAPGDANGRAYASLNQLSQGVIDGNENAWMFWFCQGPDGAPQRIAELRDPAMVQKRPRRTRRAPIAGYSPQARVPTFVPPAKSSPRPALAVPTSPSVASGDLSDFPASAQPLPSVGGMPWEPATKPKRD